MAAESVLLVEEGGRGGVADYTRELAAALAQTGWTVTIATATDHPGLPLPGVAIRGVFPYLRDSGLIGRLVRRGGLGRLVNGAGHLLAVVPLIGLARRHRIVHVQGGEWPPLGMLQALLLRGAGARLVWTPHNTFDRGPRGHRLARAAMERICGAIVLHAESDLTTLGPTGRARAHVIAHGEYGTLARRHGALISPDAARAALELPDASLVVLLFGQLRSDKGVSDLLRAARDLPELHVVLAGEEAGGLADAGDLLVEAQRQRRVTIRPGFVPSEEVAWLFSAADLVALPYRRASASGVLLLAAGLERPAAVYPVGGLPEYVADGETGWICASPTPDSLRAVLEQVVAEGRVGCRRRGIAARRRAETAFAWPRIAGLTADLYAEVLATADSRASRRPQ